MSKQQKNSSNKINWGKIGTHALCTVVELSIISLAEWIRYRLDIKFDKKERDDEEKERSEKEEDYGA